MGLLTNNWTTYLKNTVPSKLCPLQFHIEIQENLDFHMIQCMARLCTKVIYDNE